MPKQRFKITPAVYLVLIKEDKMLLSRRYKTGYFDGYYSLPAGHLDGKETCKQALVREAKEEIGLDLDSSGLKFIHAMNRKIPEDERIDFFFTIDEWEEEPKIMEPEKCDDLGWFEINNLPENIIPHVKQAINCFMNDINYSEREGEE